MMRGGFSPESMRNIPGLARGDHPARQVTLGFLFFVGVTLPTESGPVVSLQRRVAEARDRW